MLLIVPGDEYNKTIIKSVKKISGKKVAYVTLNKTAPSLIERFKDKKIDIGDFVFVDVISRTIQETPKSKKQIEYIDSPSALTDIALSISKYIKHKFDYVVIDAMTNIRAYHSEDTCIKFISSIINKIRGTDTGLILFSLDVKAQESLIEQASMYVDDVVHIKK